MTADEEAHAFDDACDDPECPIHGGGVDALSDEPPFNSLFDGGSPRAVRILRAKVGELEADVKDALARDPNNSIAYLTADIALVADILAQFIEWAGEWSGRDAE